MAALSYDNELEFIAQCLANSCTRQYYHRVCRSSSRFNDVGMASFYFDNEGVGFMETDEVIMMAMEFWADQLILFEEDPNVNDLINNYDPEFSKEVMPIIQVLWAETTHVGCGRSYGGRLKDILICMYGPSGLKVKEPMWLDGEPCSECGDTVCSNGLCGADFNFDYEDWEPPFIMGRANVVLLKEWLLIGRTLFFGGTIVFGCTDIFRSI